MWRAWILGALVLSLGRDRPEDGVRRFLLATGHTPQELIGMTIECVIHGDRAICESNDGFDYLCYAQTSCVAAGWSCIDLPVSMQDPLAGP